MFDTGSVPPLNETVADHIASGLVHYIPWVANFSEVTVDAILKR